MTGRNAINDGLVRDFPLLSTPRCRLVQPSLDQAAELLEIFGDPETMRYMQSPLAANLEDCRKLVMQWRDSCEKRKGFHWAVMLKDGPGRLIGVSALHHWSEEHRRVELGSYVHRRHWGQGLSTEVTRELIGFAFTKMDVHRLELRCDPRNHGSTSIARKIGMQLEGVLRDYVHVEGKGFADEAVHSLLKREYQAPRNT